MKFSKFLLFFLFLGTCLLVSCNKDEDEASFEDRIKGVWYVTLLEYSNCPDADDNGSQSLPGNCDSTECLRFTFSDDGVLAVYYFEDGDSGEDPGSYSGDEDALTLCIAGDCVSGTMEFDGNKSIFVYEEDGCDVTITFSR